MKNINFENKRRMSNSFRNERGAIDLGSIMVGIIVIGLIAGVIAATVFTIIPWTQDNAAKQQLEAVNAAENAYFGLSASVPSGLPAGTPANSFGKSSELKTAGLLESGEDYCISTEGNIKGYNAFAKSGSGKLWVATNLNPQPVIFTGTLPTDCTFLMSEGGNTNPSPTPTPTPDPSPSPDPDPSTPPDEVDEPYVDPTPDTTIFTYRCTSAVTGATPVILAVKGTETWSDAPAAPKTYTNACWCNC